MNLQQSEAESAEKAQLGGSQFVCRIRRKNLVWSFFVALLPTVIGIAFLVMVINMLSEDWTKDVLGVLVTLAVSGLFLWAGWVLCRKVNLLRRTSVVVHTGGFAYWEGGVCKTFCWDQIEDVQLKVLGRIEEESVVVGGFVPVPGSTIRNVRFDHRITVRRKDGVQVVFTDEFDNIVALARAIKDGTPLFG